MDMLQTDGMLWWPLHASRMYVTVSAVGRHEVLLKEVFDIKEQFDDSQALSGGLRVMTHRPLYLEWMIGKIIRRSLLITLVKRLIFPTQASIDIFSSSSTLPFHIPRVSISNLEKE